MILITDSNLIISALITPNGAIASIIKAKHNFQFIAPDFVFEEIDEHWDKIKVLSLLSDKELKAELLFYRNLIKVYDQKVTKKALDKAEEIVRDVDPEDVFFIALHLHTGHKIWSDDEKLKKGLTAKGYGHFFTSTEELKKHLYKKRP